MPAVDKQLFSIRITKVTDKPGGPDRQDWVGMYVCKPDLRDHDWGPEPTWDHTPTPVLMSKPAAVQLMSKALEWSRGLEFEIVEFVPK